LAGFHRRDTRWLWRRVWQPFWVFHRRDTRWVSEKFTTGNDWKRLEITGNHWKPLETTGNHWIRLETTGNNWKRLEVLKQQIVAAGAVFFSEVAVAGAAGVDVLRVGGRRGLLNGKGVFTISLAAAAILATMSMLVGKKKNPPPLHLTCVTSLVF